MVWDFALAIRLAHIRQAPKTCCLVDGHVVCLLLCSSSQQIKRPTPFHTWCGWLLRLVMQLRQPWVLERCCHVNALAGVELKHLVHEVQCLWVCVWELL